MGDEEREYLPHSSRCFICGDENGCGVRTRFFVQGDAVRTRVTLPRHVNGYKDIAHGGVIAALLAGPRGGKFLPRSPEETARVIPYLKFDQCRKYRTLFDYAKEPE